MELDPFDIMHHDNVLTKCIDLKLGKFREAWCDYCKEFKGKLNYCKVLRKINCDDCDKQSIDDHTPILMTNVDGCLHPRVGKIVRDEVLNETN